MNEAETISLQKRIDKAEDAASALRVLAQVTAGQDRTENCHIWRITIETWIREWRNQLEVEA